MTSSVKTVDQARTLPEIRSAMYDFQRTTDPITGITTETRTARPLSPRPIGGDEILLFADTDGRLMQVVWTEDGPAKTEARI